jgi:ribosome-associated translation inhibitor RaiA/cold shock CspA family protein
MERPLEIAFHNLPSSPELEAEIRRRAERLSKRYDRLTGCRVSVEALHQQHRTGNLFEVHVVLAVPRRLDLTVSHEPHKANIRYANPDALTSIRGAFKAAERQLSKYKERLRENTSGPSGSAIGGEVAQIEPGADHGFLTNSIGSRLYFHRDSVTDGRFEDLRPGDRVHYVEEEADSGPVAIKVRTAGR